MSIAHLLNATAEVYRSIRVSDGQGGAVETYQPHHTMPVRVSTPSATERLVAAQSGADVVFVGYTEADADVKRGDQWQGSTLARFGPPLEVVALYPPSEPHHLKVGLATRQREAV